MEVTIGRKLFSHACSHQSNELVVKTAYIKIFGVETTGSENNHFQKF